MAARGKLRLRPPRLLRDAPKQWPPDVAVVADRGADEKVVVLDEGADGRPRGRPNADDAVAAAVAATRMPPDGKRLPFPASCRRPQSLRLLLLLLLLLEPAMNYQEDAKKVLLSEA